MGVDFELVVTTDAENPVAHDLRLVDSETPLIEGDAAVRQHLRVRLQFFLGEWKNNRLEGIPFYRDIFVKNPSLGLISSVFRQVILITPGVESLDSFDLVIDSALRTLDLAFVAFLDSGEVLAVDYGDFIIEVI